MTLLAAAPVRAQVRSVSDGLRVNVHAGLAHLGGDHGGSGVRPGISVSYGNSRWFAGFVTYDRAPISDDSLTFHLRHIDAGARVHLLGADSRLVPFVLAAYTWRTADYGIIPFLGDTLDVKVHGSGLTLGGGAAWHLSPRLALEVSLERTGGAMDRVTADGLTFRREESAIPNASVRLNVGVSWWIPR